MKTAKQIFTHYVRNVGKYDGPVSCRKIRRRGNKTWYRIKIVGEEFIAVFFDDIPGIVFFTQYWRKDTGVWLSTEGKIFFRV